MPGKMSLVLVKETGSVLTFGTRLAVPAVFEDFTDLEGEELTAFKENELTELVGPELLVRFDWKPTDTDFNSAEFRIPGNELDVSIADTDEAVTARPRKFCVDGSGKLSAVLGTVTMPNKLKDTITVHVSVPVGSDTKVWVRVQAATEDDSRIARGVLRPGVLGGDDADIAFPELPPGKYLALVAVAGYPLLAEKFTI